MHEVHSDSPEGVGEIFLFVSLIEHTKIKKNI